MRRWENKMELIVERVNQTGTGFVSGGVWYNVNRFADPVPTLVGVTEGSKVEVELNKGGFINKIMLVGGQAPPPAQASPPKQAATPLDKGATYAAKSGRGQQTGNVLSNAVLLTTALIAKGYVKNVEGARGSVATLATFLDSVADRLNGVPVKASEGQPEETKKEETPL